VDANAAERAALLRYLIAHRCVPDTQTMALTVVREVPVLTLKPLDLGPRWMMRPDTRQGVTYANTCPF
jgi:hypothetical protein